MNKLRRFLRRARRVLAGADPTIPPGLFAHQTQVFYRIQFLIRGFYAFLAFTAILLVPEWPGILDRGSVDPLWPVFWMTHLNLRFGIGLVLGLYTVGALLAAALPEFRWTRVLAFLGLLEYWAFNNSFGKVGHSLHDTLLVTFVFVFLPVGWHENDQHRRLGRQETLLVFWLAQCTIMVTYSMAGFIKVVAGVAQLLKGEPNLFWPDALARQVADRLLQTNSQSWWGDWLVTHPGLSYPMLIGTVYLELFALWAVFRPRLQPAFVLGLVLFHISSFFSMTIIFPQNCFLLFLFFAGMPLLTEPWTWASFIRDWPLLGNLFVLWKKRAS